jgi:hypothetical protein
MPLQGNQSIFAITIGACLPVCIFKLYKRISFDAGGAGWECLAIRLLIDLVTLRRFVLLLTPVRALAETELARAGCLVRIQTASCLTMRNTTPHS